MKKNRFTQAEIIHVLEQAKAGIPVRELLRKYAISQASFYTWRKKYAGPVGKRSRPAEATRGGEHQAQEGRGGVGP